MAIDQNAMFRAGLSSKAKRNIEAEKSDKRIARFNTVANTAYSLLGKAALGQLSQNYQMLQKYRNKADNDVGMLGLQMDKMPKNNPGLREDLEALSKLHSEANKRANLGIGGKKRAQARQDAAGYRQQLTDLKQAMTVISTQAIEAQGMVGIDSGLVQAGGDQASMSSGASRFAQGNTIALAEGSLLQRARWNSDATKGPIGLNVLVGGEYRDGKYVDKLETGTYEKYVAAENAPIGEGDNEVERLERSKNQENNFYPLKEGGPKEAVMSREEWTKLNQENRGLISQTPWSTLKFAEKEDKTTSNNLAEYADAKIQDANSRNSLTWDQVTENEKEEFVAKMDEYTDLQFRDYFFGGGTFTASATRIPNSAPAYLFLKEEDEKNGNFKDGEFKEGFGPGNENWEGRILTLQGQSFVKGSQYRKTTAEQQWGMLGEKYKTNRKNWRIANPEKNDNDNDDDDDNNVFLGLGKSNGSNIYLPQSRVTDKYNELASLTQSGKTGVVLGWEGSNTTRYRKYNKDDKFFNYQIYNPKTGAFETKKVNGKPVQFSIDEVIDDMNFPSSYNRSSSSTIIEKNGKKYKKVDGGYMEIK